MVLGTPVVYMYTHIAKQYLLVDDTQFEQLLPSLENKACLGFVAVRAVAPEQITRSDPDKDQNGHPRASQDIPVHPRTILYDHWTMVFHSRREPKRSMPFGIHRVQV